MARGPPSAGEELVIHLDADAFEAMVERAVRKALGSQSQADSFLSVSAAADLADTSTRWIRDQLKAGRLTKHHAGSQLRVSRCELVALLSSAPVRELTPEELARRTLKVAR